MDLNKEYAAHQHALMRAASTDDRVAHLALASAIAARIGAFQRELRATAASIWSMAQVSASGRA